MTINYDYKERSKIIRGILNSAIPIEKVEKVPKDDADLTYNNGVRSWVGAIFIDIVKSTNLISREDELQVAKILRSFSSEIISILNQSENVREIGIRGDCVFGIFATPKTTDVHELYIISAWINTLIAMLNKLFAQKGYPTIQAGIGVAIGDDLIIKAGYKGSGINDRIWIGKAVVDACNLANKANRNGNKPIGYSRLAYENFIKHIKDPNAKSWFIEKNQEVYANIIMTDFDNWIKNNL